MNLGTGGLKQLISSDKRKSDRLVIPLGLFFSLPQEHGWNGPLEVLDIGGSGLKFAFSQEFKIGTELNLRLTFPENSQRFIDAKAKVAWCKLKSPAAYYTGVHITMMQPQDRTRYVMYICDKILLAHLKKELTP